MPGYVVDEKFAGLPAGTRATQLPSPDIDNYFLKVFGQPARETACQCERSSDSNLSQALQMINGPLVHSKVRDEKNRLRTLVAASKTDADVVGELYLAALSRPPSEAETPPPPSTSPTAATACVGWRTCAGPC